jgi:hypothetical protein
LLAAVAVDQVHLMVLVVAAALVVILKALVMQLQVELT